MAPAPLPSAFDSALDLRATWLHGYMATSMSWMTDQKRILFLYPSSFVRSHSRSGTRGGRSSVQQAQVKVGEDPQIKEARATTNKARRENTKKPSKERKTEDKHTP